jgi:hypothetical protein
VERGLTRLLVGDRRTIAGTVYGTIIVLAVLTAGAKPYEHHLWRLVAIAGVSAVVLWLAHVYSHGLGESLGIGRRLTLGELAAIARQEYSIVAAAILPLTAVALGAAGIVGEQSSIWLAFGIGVVTLTAQGVRYAQLEDLSAAATLVTVSLNVAFGLGLVALEVLVAH